MTLKRFLFIPLLISIVIFIHYSAAVRNSFSLVLHSVHGSGLVAVLILASIVQIVGHIIRAQKMRLLLSPVKLSTLRFQFRALSVGYLFNALLPFRLGELVRAQIIAGAENISFGYALSLVVIERLVDALVLGTIGLVFFTSIGLATSSTLEYAIFLLLLVAVVSIFIWLLVRENQSLLRVWYRLTAWFNQFIQNSLRFKAWSIIYGLQQTFTRKRAAQYLGLTILSWMLYGISVLIIAQYLFPNLGFHYKLGLAAGPYYGVSVPAGPANLGVYSKVTNSYSRNMPLSPNQRVVFDLLSWTVLIGPIAALGIIFFFTKTKESLWRSSSPRLSATSIHKLARTQDISQEMSKFLENYFSGNTLSRIVHRLELHENFRLLKYFKGGSDAITILALQDNQEIVKKIIPPEFENRLKAQYEWLQARRGQEGIVKVLGEEKAEDYYAINLEYRSDDTMFFDFMHHNSLDRSAAVLEQVWGYLRTSIHSKPAKLSLHSKERRQYIDKHILGCIEKAAQVYPELMLAVAPSKLKVNGREYDNLYQIMEKIKAHPQAWRDIATYQATKEVHGDVAIDNILVSQSTGNALLIDPAPDGNIINGPVFDFGKNLQSLYCGYEFLLRDEDPVYLQDDAINYREHSSIQYNRLYEYVRDTLAPKYLSPEEQRSLLFHAAALHIRRLKHQVHYNPANTLKFYAVGVKTLNDFLAQYE